MAARESWSKHLKCPVCGREGVAQMSHVDNPSDQYDEKTIVDDCPAGFDVREDEDDSNIFRFYCATHQVSADQ